MTDIRIISILLLLLWSGPALAGEAVLVVHRDNPISSLELTEVRSIFLGKKVFWDDGNAIEVLLQESGETHRNFSQNILGKSPRQLSMYWKRVLFSGEGLPPREVTGDEEMLETIAANTKAIGYIDNSVNDNRVKSVSIIREE
ncbi:hypothetical protein [Trichloromonas acetexigens]|jgi:ABC-type phosphate transport system substrate-binding protein|uniref:PBP domain-containing protein n=1 Tax=Trichloromonas acetexigens TaxID=38815 RepID=A0A550JL89_9BACT|nr:hypothetical protein [Desulfuromonas acetexigens]TRO83986.1 hypothetical protein FL622_02055 [Desulfuromonas acetexigens]